MDEIEERSTMVQRLHECVAVFKDCDFKHWIRFSESMCFSHLVKEHSRVYITLKASKDVQKGIFAPPSKTGILFRQYKTEYIHCVNCFQYEKDDLPF